MKRIIPDTTNTNVWYNYRFIAGMLYGRVLRLNCLFPENELFDYGPLERRVFIRRSGRA